MNFDLLVLLFRLGDWGLYDDKFNLLDLKEIRERWRSCMFVHLDKYNLSFMFSQSSVVMQI